MSHKHESLLRSILDGPVGGNVHWREVESFLHHLGAEMEPIQGARFKVVLNGVEGVLHRPHHSNVLDAHSLLHLRGFLARAGVTPSLYETKDAAAKPGQP